MIWGTVPLSISNTSDATADGTVPRYSIADNHSMGQAGQQMESAGEQAGCGSRNLPSSATDGLKPSEVDFDKKATRPVGALPGCYPGT